VEHTNLFRQAKQILRLYGFSPRKHLGQHFLVNPEVLNRLVSRASLDENDVVLEVGAGLGFITSILSSKCRKVVAVEVDSRLVKLLTEQFRRVQNVEVIEGDALKVSLPYFTKVVSAPPYSLSSPIIFRLLERSFDVAVLILQKEFAERLAAPVGSKDYGRLTVTVYYRAEAELLDYVPRTNFYPPPDVDSMIVRLRPRSPPFRVEDEQLFFELIRTLFTQRNKKVRNPLITFLCKRGLNRKDAVALADSAIYSTKRVRELAPEDFGILSNELTNLFRRR